ncbi:tetratricopeptide repeat protein [Psychromonas sp. Urea-02u-13]|uniref:tetratricopeptide repeat protein n=1 Tax=Psychromonas sp. Urea-02u-13 TaxID=2058326 RepID=UPI000C3253EB|nr:tetratricopeptide repeat protein [Psychromonas sp. Urea-02u-13]PKG38326.1 hypothetical protein CXF74_14145 [Psychromonas sp. Urea-02u-13]
MNWLENVFIKCKLKSEQGNSVALYHLGLLYEGGRGVKQNPVNAMDAYVKAAQCGEKKALARLTVIYQNGNGLMQFDKQVANVMYQSAKAYDENIRGIQGAEYQKVKSVNDDAQLALTLYRESAEAGDVISNLVLAYMYENLESELVNDASTDKHLIQRLEQSRADARHKLALFYENSDQYENAFNYVQLLYQSLAIEHSILNEPYDETLDVTWLVVEASFHHCSANADMNAE